MSHVHDSIQNPTNPASAMTPLRSVPALDDPPVPSTDPPSTARHGGGPRTAAGRQAVSSNAVSHGITSRRPVIKGETTEEWEAHHQAMRDRFQPADGYEDLLVYQVALTLVSMDRLERYQHGVIQNQLEALDEPGRFAAPPGALYLAATPQEPDGLEPVLRLVAELDQLDDDTRIGEVEAEMVLLALPGDTRGEGLGVPPGREPPDMTGWTAKSLRACIGGAAEAAGVEPAEILRATRDELITLRANVERKRAQARRDRAAELDRRRRRERAERTAILPRQEVLEQVMRYRAQLERSLERFMKLLETAQRARAGTLPRRCASR